MEDNIVKVIQEINPFDDFDTDTELLEEGILDSLTLMIFIERIEETFEIEVPEEYVILENFATVKTIMQMIEKLKQH